MDDGPGHDVGERHARKDTHTHNEQIEANKKAKIKSIGKDKTSIILNSMRCSGLQ